jgi:hypothetical protein
VNGALGAIIWIAVIAAYWTPSLVAGIRHVPNSGSVVVINLFLGWTLVGWVVALAMACRSHPQQAISQPPSQPAPLPQPGSDRS